MTHTEKAVNYFAQKLHCSQSVLGLLGCDVRTKEGVQYCLDNKLFIEFCPKMVSAAVEVVEGIIEEMK